MKKLPIHLLILLSAPLGLCALDVTVEAFRDGKIPTGYIIIEEGISADEMIKVSEPPYVDYLIPNNSGATGITAQKQGGQYIVESTVGELPGGANNGAGAPDIYHVAFEWNDGIPLPFGSEYWGVSWGGWAANETVFLLTRINLASAEPLRIFHWFNDGWNYNNHETLDGHNLAVTHYDSQGNTVDSFTAVLPSGGAEAIFGDHRQFYTAIIDVQATGDGDFLLIQQEGGNIGLKGTAVALAGAPQKDWLGFPVDDNGWANSGDWLSWLNVTYDPWILIPQLQKYVTISDASGWIYVPKE